MVIDVTALLQHKRVKRLIQYEGAVDISTYTYQYKYLILNKKQDSEILVQVGKFNSRFWSTQ